MCTVRGARRCGDDGFTLVELLIVIVILGVLSTVTVFAVSGITSRGEEAASDADGKALATAEEAYYADQGVYASEQELVDQGFIVSLSTTFDIRLGAGNRSYQLVAPGQGAGSGVTDVTIGGFTAEAYGSGGSDVVILGSSRILSSQWSELTAGPAPVNHRFVFVNDPAVDSQAEVFSLVDGATLAVVQSNWVVGGGAIGAAMTSRYGAPYPAAGYRWFGWDAQNDVASFVSAAGLD